MSHSITTLLTCNWCARAYETSKLYRDLKLRGSIIRDGELILLPNEQIFTKVRRRIRWGSVLVLVLAERNHSFALLTFVHFEQIVGVWNLSSDQGNLGTFFLTNVRLVWHANLASNFNVSLPYMQIKTLKVRDSKFGYALVLETFARSGGYILGFRIDPKEKLDEAFKELVNLHQVYATTPNFGVEFAVEAEAPSIQQLLAPRVEEDVEIIDDMADAHAMAAYYVEGSEGAQEGGEAHQNVVFDSRVGLAVEGMQPGMSLDSLWRVM